MGWFKDLFTTKDVVTDSGLPKVSNIHPMPTVKPCKPEKEISEPVYAIVKAMQERPSNFKIKLDIVASEKLDWVVLVFDVTDIKTNQKVRAVRAYCYQKYSYRIAWDWLTKEEEEFLGKAANKVYDKKWERLNNIKRAKMKAIYNTKENNK